MEHREAFLLGTGVIVFPTVSRYGIAATRNNDLPLLVELREPDPENEVDRTLCVEGVTRYADVGQIVVGRDAVVTSRFNPIFGALSTGVPSFVIGLIYEYREVLVAFELQHRAFSVAALTVKR